MWLETHISGWPAFIVKEKLKCLKVKLKAWNIDSFGCLDQNTDIGDETIDMDIDQILLRKNPLADWWSVVNIKEIKVFIFRNLETSV
ncbi:hypothetical protein Lalb_Chr23g0276161 [Lupinus albus]|uniref:Uncharacterized protein n=1 Tax=Lupinus albus TaxID=3870 RepID=A0A6A4NJX2_LUPAL|nr:hypothetical protein Lalb_Chr23g0276161 [Lupinus albus]